MWNNILATVELTDFVDVEVGISRSIHWSQLGRIKLFPTLGLPDLTNWAICFFGIKLKVPCDLWISKVLVFPWAVSNTYWRA
jgi:hypothetical protein